MKKTVIIIGAGVGGMACAALLAKAGHEVTVLESHPFIGGRCATLEKDGFIYDFGVHMFSRGDCGPHGITSRRVNGDLQWITREPSCRVMGKMEFDFPLDIRPFSRQAKLAFQLGVRPKNLFGVWRLFRALMNGRNVEANDNTILEDYILRYTDDERIHLFITCVSQLYFALSARQASAGEFIWSFSRMFNDAAFGYPKGGGRAIPQAFADALIRTGGTIAYETPVTAIRVENNRVSGVDTATGFLPADIVISNAGLNRTIDLAGADVFPADYVNRAGSMRYSNPYVTNTYALDRPVVPYPVVFYMPDIPADKIFAHIENNTAPEDPYLFMPIPSNLDPGLAPPGKQLVIAGTPVAPGASDDVCRQTLDRIDERVHRLFPGIKEALIWQEQGTRADTTRITTHPPGGAIGLGQFPDQTGNQRPSLQTPVDGLYLVGADAGSRGIGTELAVGSALNLADLLAEIPAHSE
jgi:prolycopene isomerase